MRSRLYSELPRFEGDQLVTITGSITIDATKGNRKVPFSLWVARDNESVQAILLRGLRFFALLVPAVLLANTSRATIEDTGSTNRPGLRVTFDREGHAAVEPRHGETQHVTLPSRICKRFMQDLEAAGPVNELPAVHCMKSVSFGSRTFVIFEGNRSPDLSCPVTENPRNLALQKDVDEILHAARDAAGIRSSRVFTIPAPHAAK